MALKTQINGVAGVAPIILSLTAFGMALYAGLRGLDRGAADEGTLAHVFQLLILVQAPIIALFLGTSDWKRAGTIAIPLAAHIGGVILAVSAVLLFKL